MQDTLLSRAMMEASSMSTSKDTELAEKHTCILGLWGVIRGTWAGMPVCTCWSKAKDRGRAKCSKGGCRALFRHGHRRISPGAGRRGGVLGNSRGGEGGVGRVGSRSG